MLICVDIVKYLPLAMLMLSAIVFIIAAAFMFVRVIKQNIRLRNSIILVQIKSLELIYIVLFIISTAITILFLVNSITPFKAFEELFISALTTPLTITLSFSALTALFASISVIFLMLAISKCALLDKGVYSKGYFYAWHSIYDYMVDEQNCTVILSANKSGALSLSGLSPRLKFSREDTERIKFILNKNKNKFSNYEIR